MASGYGYNGGPGRCLPFWQEVVACYMVSAETGDPKAKRKCVPVLDDYYECLHHKKEAARVRTLQDAYRNAERAGEHGLTPTAGQVRSLGLLGKDEEKKGGVGAE